MAYVKILQNKTRVALRNLLKYLTNEHEGKVCISASNLSEDPEVAYHMISVQNATGLKDRKICVHSQHLIQSFSPKDNITPEKANELGNELMERLGYKQYGYTVVTHADRDHIHNHIVFSPTSLVTQKQYRVNKKELNRIRSVSDDICRENKQNVIEKRSFGIDKAKRANYYQWQHWQRKESAKLDIKLAVDRAIQYSFTYESLIDRLNTWGYETTDVGRELQVKHPKLDYAIDITKLGEAYRKPSLSKRMEEILELRKTTKSLLNVSKSTSYYGQNYAAIENIKIMSRALHFMKKNNLNTAQDFSMKESELNQLKESYSNELKQLEKAIEQYQEYFTDVDVIEANEGLLKRYLNASPEEQEHMVKDFHMENLIERLEKSTNFYNEHKDNILTVVQKQAELLEKHKVLKEQMKAVCQQMDVLKNAKDVLLQKNLLPKQYTVFPEQKRTPEEIHARLLERMNDFAQDKEVSELFARWKAENEFPKQQEEKVQPKDYNDLER